MHPYPAGMIGILVAIGTWIAAADHLVAFMLTPFTVSGTALALMMLPLGQRS